MSLIRYLLEANLYLVAFYGLYVTLLRKETFYQFNRTYLLITTLLAFIIPVLQIGYLKPVTNHVITHTLVNESLTTVTIVPSTATVVQEWTVADYALMVYGIVCAALLLLLILKILKLILLSRKGIINRRNGFLLVEVPQDNVAFSFFGYLFIDTKFTSSQTILLHEEVHIRQKHSWDIVYFELLKIINWFNPVIYLLQKNLKEVHEFIADEQVAAVDNNASAYVDFLISNAYGLSQSQITNSFFNKNLLKQRIIMLYQKKSGKAARLKYLLTLPLAGGLLCMSTLAFTTKTYVWADIVPKQEINEVPTPVKSFSNPQPAYSSKHGTVINAVKTDVIQKEVEPTLQKADTLSNKIQHLNTAITKAIIAQVAEARLLNGNKLTDSATSNVFIDNRDDFKDLNRYMSVHIRYPNIAKDNYIQGRVFITFTVDEDKNIQNLLVLRAPDQSLGNEAARALKAMGKLDNAKSDVTYSLPIHFKINFDDFKTDPPKPVDAKPVYNKKVQDGNTAYMLDEVVVMCYSKLNK